MAAQPVEDPDLLDQLATLSACLDAIPVAGYAALPPNRARQAAATVRALQSRLATHVGAAVRAVEALVAARDTRQLLAGDFGNDPASAHRQLRDAHALDGAGATEQAAADGTISHLHATIIGKALQELPAEATDANRQRAEQVLIGDAQRLSPKDLTTRARRISELWAPTPEVDATEDELLRRREVAARAKTSLTMWDNRDGSWSGKFTLPEIPALMLKTVIDAYAAPRRERLTGEGRTNGGGEAASAGPLTRVQQARIEAEGGVPYNRKAGDAFATLIEHLPADRLPTTGGTPARIVVAISEAGLRSRVAGASLTTGQRVSASELRRLACTHGILPAVFGGASVPVDLGRTQRLFTPYQRDALAVMDGGCITPGCERPPAWCEAHHGGDPWNQGGKTNLDEGYLLCSGHHHDAHQGNWTFRRRPDGTAELNRGNGWESNQRYRPEVVAVQGTTAP